MDDFLAIVSVLGKKNISESKVKNIWDLELAIIKGLPVRALETLIERIYPEQNRKLYEIISRSTWRNRQKSGYLNFYESERTARIARIYGFILEIWSTEPEAARLFMQTPHRLLENRSPFNVCKTELGARRVEQILYAIEYGIFV